MMSDYTELIQTFNQWFTRNGGFYAPGTALTWTEENGISVQIKDGADLPKLGGQPIVTCPHTLSISSLNALNTHAAFEDRLPFRLPEQLLHKGSPRLIGAVFLCAHYLLGSKSFWCDYFNVLPGVPGKNYNRGIGVVQNPLWWSDKEKAWLDGTNVERGVRDLLKSWELEWENWERTLTEWASSVGLEGFDWTIFKWALSILGSRSFSSVTVKHIQGGTVLRQHNPHSLLYPGIDLLNHNPETKNKWRYDAEAFRIEMRDAVNHGPSASHVELWNTYGTQSNAQLLLSWGFCLAKNKYDSYALQLLTPQDGSTTDEYHDHETASADQQESDNDHLPVTADYLNATAEEARLGIYMVRDPTTIDADDEDYPSAEYGVWQHLTGFPKSLPSRVAQQVLNVREREKLAHRATPPADYYDQVSGRVQLATCDLLHQKLQVVLEQQLEDPGSPYAIARRLPSDQLSPLSRQRLNQVQVYRDAQARLLRSNINRLECILSNAKQVNAHALGLPELATLPRLLDFLNSRAPHIYRELTAGDEFGSAFPDGTLFRVARDDLFMCIVVAVFHLHELGQSELHDHRLYNVLDSVRTMSSWYYDEERADPGGLDFTGFARGQDAMMWVEEVAAYAGRAKAATASGLWHNAAWTDHVFLRAIVILVMEESFELDVDEDTTEIAIYLG